MFIEVYKKITCAKITTKFNSLDLNARTRTIFVSKISKHRLLYIPRICFISRQTDFQKKNHST